MISIFREAAHHGFILSHCAVPYMRSCAVLGFDTAELPWPPRTCTNLLLPHWLCRPARDPAPERLGARPAGHAKIYMVDLEELEQNYQHLNSRSQPDLPPVTCHVPVRG